MSDQVYTTTTIQDVTCMADSPHSFIKDSFYSERSQDQGHGPLKKEAPKTVQLLTSLKAQHFWAHAEASSQSLHLK